MRHLLVLSLFVVGLPALANSTFDCTNPAFPQNLFEMDLGATYATLQLRSPYDIKTFNEDGTPRMTGSLPIQSYGFPAERTHAEILLHGDTTEFFSLYPSDAKSLRFEFKLPADDLRGDEFQMYAQIFAILEDGTERSEWTDQINCHNKSLGR